MTKVECSFVQYSVQSNDSNTSSIDAKLFEFEFFFFYKAAIDITFGIYNIKSMKEKEMKMFHVIFSLISSFIFTHNQNTGLRAFFVIIITIAYREQQ